MYHPDQIGANERIAALAQPFSAGRCLAPGCSCKDARIVSRRKAAFFAATARRRNETADRVIAPEPGWRLVAALGA